MFEYTDAFSTKRTPQGQPVPGKQMVQGEAGGFVFGVDDWTRLDRFLILGSDAPTYYASAPELTKENAGAVVRCLKENGVRVVDRIVEISEAGRAPKNDPALFALALASSPAFANPATRSYALSSLSRVARIGTHLFHFAKYVEHFRGWGRGLREGVAAWYTEKEVDRLAYQAVKYQQRDGWSHRDLLRLSHPKPPTKEHDRLFHWITQSNAKKKAPNLVHAFEEAKLSPSAKETARLIREYNLTREMVKTSHLKDAGVWEALLERMPMTAMVRNLANMTKVGLLAPMSSAVGTVVSRLDSDAVHKARVHPLQILVAMKVYQQGHGVARRQAVGYHSRGYVGRGDVPSWRPVVQIVDALDAAFYHAFDNVESTGLRWLLALDVSGSMASPDISGMPGISPRVGSAAMALITAKAEPNYTAVGFTSGSSSRYDWRRNTALTHLPISPRQRLDDVIGVVSNLPFGGTDCSLPIVGALQKQVPVDVFVVYTDSETWAGNIHPVQALQEYRQKMGINAKLIVVGMVSNGFSIADPSDGGMLDVVGFDTATPQVMADFSRG